MYSIASDQQHENSSFILRFRQLYKQHHYSTLWVSWWYDSFKTDSLWYSCLVFCVVLLCVFTFWVPCCDVRYDFHIKAMFGSSLPPVVCRRTRVIFTFFVVVYVWRCPTHIVLCFCCVCLCLVYPMLSVSLDCTLLIAPSLFSNVYFVPNTICK